MHRIFISSVQHEFAAERRALKDYIQGDPLLRRFFEVFLFEDLPASDRRADAAYLGEVEHCEVYIGLFGQHYGTEDAAGVSGTEHEFNRAAALGKPRFVYIKGPHDAVRHPKIAALIRRADDQLIRRRFVGVADLNASVYASLVDHLENNGLLRVAPFDAAACNGAALTDLSAEKIDLFLARAQATRSYPLGPGTPAASALAHLNLLDHNIPSHAAMLLFAEDPQRWLPTSIVKCLHFHGTEISKPIPSHQVYRGTVFALVDQAVDFVMSKVARSVGTRAEGNVVPVSYELPREAVAEAIVNAVAHRNYASNASVQVMLFSNRLEVWNPGELPPTLSPERLKRPHPSIPRNPLLADPFFLAGYIEQAGTGTLDMIARSREAGLKLPEFRQDGGSFVQTLWRPTPPKTTSPAAPAKTATPQVAPQVTPQDKILSSASLMELAKTLGISTTQVTPQVAKQVTNVLQGAADAVSRESLQASVGMSDRKHFSQVYLEPLVSSGWLERTVPEKPTSRLQRYRLTDKGRAWLGKSSS